MKAVYALTLVALLSACAAKVVQSTPRTVMISAGSADPSGALVLGQAECAKHGRSARLNTQPNDNRLWVFDCVE